LSGSAYDWIDQALVALRRVHRYRSVQTLEGAAGPVVQRQGQALVNFASNDYLGLANHPQLAAAAIAAVQTYGSGSTGSPLLTGHRPLHRQLERAIAELKGTADALIFSSGYLANLGTLGALVGSPDLILGDQYNHASLKAGARVSGATHYDYRHGDMAHLKALLKTHRHRHRRCLITSDSVFSMDGDLCPLGEILPLAQAYDAMVLVDEAHGTGVFGPGGGGLVEHLGYSGYPLVQMGTLSKALASLGGYVAGPQPLIDFLRNRASGWIYTTALSPADTGAALAAIALVSQESERRQRLWQHVADLNHRLDQLLDQHRDSPVRPLPSASPIICLEYPSAAAVLAASQQLQSLGLWLAAVRPPTVPTSRLRLTLMATHQSDHLARLIAGLGTVL
jgi:8-amino-7-oxononanoate synthase